VRVKWNSSVQKLKKRQLYDIWYIQPCFMAITNAFLVADVPTYHGDNYVSNMLKIRNMVTVWNSSECSYIMHHCICNHSIIQVFVTVMQQIK